METCNPRPLSSTRRGSTKQTTWTKKSSASRWVGCRCCQKSYANTRCVLRASVPGLAWALCWISDVAWPVVAVFPKKLGAAGSLTSAEARQRGRRVWESLKLPALAFLLCPHGARVHVRYNTNFWKRRKENEQPYTKTELPKAQKNVFSAFLPATTCSLKRDKTTGPRKKRPPISKLASVALRGRRFTNDGGGSSFRSPKKKPMRRAFRSA